MYVTWVGEAEGVCSLLLGHLGVLLACPPFAGGSSPCPCRRHRASLWHDMDLCASENIITLEKGLLWTSREADIPQKALKLLSLGLQGLQSAFASCGLPEKKTLPLSFLPFPLSEDAWGGRSCAPSHLTAPLCAAPLAGGGKSPTSPCLLLCLPAKCHHWQGAAARAACWDALLSLPLSWQPPDCMGTMG